MQSEIDILIYLRKSVIRTFGKKISTSTHCDQLSDLLFEKYQANISGQTLRRFFGLIKSTSGSSRFTLDLLSKFCGSKDFRDFSLLHGSEELESFFGNAEDSTKDYWGKSKEICIQISNSKELLVDIHHRLLTMPLARKYFMENHPSRDLLGTVYTQYFLSYLKYNNCDEAKIFAYGFLFKAAFLQENEVLMELYYSQIINIDLDEHVHVIPAGLKFGVQLLFEDYIGDHRLFKATFNKMKKVRLHYTQYSQKSVCSFEYTVLESLIFTDRISEIKFLLDNNCEQTEQDQEFIPEERKKTHDEVWIILRALSYQKMGDSEKSQFYLDQVDLKNLGIGWEKFYSLVFYLTELKQNKIIEESDLISKIKKLILETHFNYFDTELSEILKKRKINSKSLGKIFVN
ncbi:hypothetical protein [Halpernia frigidisoli]|uniref:Uncharacterized protein n=1 Tax=Halpernia frigidisoli TaxID=1125876 RepID=A0A1I3J1X5_9FLAO|nr:hypothetical protein [Halpernia frigidisoli]SFI54234.1 hypothetical protein SAMN05443292_2893 [Halpernia frigidisoli]